MRRRRPSMATRSINKLALQGFQAQLRLELH
ncbi:hypothetical protein BDL97_03G030400 [Sphagnum fallax]|nr:hypothetical protein BDL97_03G030400 [Sphagnum fallax]